MIFPIGLEISLNSRNTSRMLSFPGIYDAGQKLQCPSMVLVLSTCSYPRNMPAISITQISTFMTHPVILVWFWRHTQSCTGKLHFPTFSRINFTVFYTAIVLRTVSYLVALELPWNSLSKWYNLQNNIIIVRQLDWFWWANQSFLDLFTSKIK